MSTVDEILTRIPLDQVARTIGVDPQTAEKAVRAALPALLRGAQNDNTGTAAASLPGLDALTGLFGRDRINVDEAAQNADAARAGVGEEYDKAADDVRREAGLDKDKTGRLLKILIPIVVGFVAWRAIKKHKENAAAEDQRRANDPNYVPRGEFREGSVLDRIRDAIVGDDKPGDK